MEQIDKIITYELKKERSRVDGKRNEKRGFKKNLKYRVVTCWNLIVKKKQGKSVHKVNIRKRKIGKKAEMAGNEEDRSLRETEIE